MPAPRPLRLQSPAFRGRRAHAVGVLAALLGVLLISPHAYAANSIRLIEENDFFAGHQDELYTQGLQLCVDRSPTSAPGPAGGVPWGSLGTRFLIGQNMYTPSNISVDTLRVGDRPYAGWLYLGAEARTGNSERSHLLRAYVGVLGPHAYAGETQRSFHRLIHQPIPQGWDLQLPDRLAANLFYDYQRTVAEAALGSGRFARLWLGAGAAAGQVFVSADGGFAATLGSIRNPLWDVQPGPPSLFGSDRATATGGATADRFQWALIVRGRVRRVLRNAFLDDSPRQGEADISRRPWVADGEMGALFRLQRLTFQYMLVGRTPEFSPNDHGHAFGSFQIAVRLPGP